MFPFELLNYHYGNDEFELRQVAHLNRAQGAQEVKGVFKIISVEGLVNFDECVNIAVRNLADLIRDTPSTWCFRMEHPALRTNTNALFINYDPRTVNVGELLARYLLQYQMSGCELQFSDQMIMTVMTFD